MSPRDPLLAGLDAADDWHTSRSTLAHEDEDTPSKRWSIFGCRCCRGLSHRSKCCVGWTIIALLLVLVLILVLVVVVEPWQLIQQRVRLIQWDFKAIRWSRSGKLGLDYQLGLAPGLDGGVIEVGRVEWELDYRQRPLLKCMQMNGFRLEQGKKEQEEHVFQSNTSFEFGSSEALSNFLGDFLNATEKLSLQMKGHMMDVHVFSGTPLFGRLHAQSVPFESSWSVDGLSQLPHFEISSMRINRTRTILSTEGVYTIDIDCKFYQPSLLLDLQIGRLPVDLFYDPSPIDPQPLDTRRSVRIAQLSTPPWYRVQPGWNQVQLQGNVSVTPSDPNRNEAMSRWLTDWVQGRTLLLGLVASSGATPFFRVQSVYRRSTPTQPLQVVHLADMRLQVGQERPLLSSRVQLEWTLPTVNLSLQSIRTRFSLYHCPVAALTNVNANRTSSRTEACARRQPIGSTVDQTRSSVVEKDPAGRQGLSAHWTREPLRIRAEDRVGFRRLLSALLGRWDVRLAVEGVSEVEVDGMPGVFVRELGWSHEWTVSGLGVIEVDSLEAGLKKNLLVANEDQEESRERKQKGKVKEEQESNLEVKKDLKEDLKKDLKENNLKEENDLEGEQLVVTQNIQVVKVGTNGTLAFKVDGAHLRLRRQENGSGRETVTLLIDRPLTFDLLLSLEDGSPSSRIDSSPSLSAATRPFPASVWLGQVQLPSLLLGNGDGDECSHEIVFPNGTRVFSVPCCPVALYGTLHRRLANETDVDGACVHPVDCPTRFFLSRLLSPPALRVSLQAIAGPSDLSGVFPAWRFSHLLFPPHYQYEFNQSSSPSPPPPAPTPTAPLPNYPSIGLRMNMTVQPGEGIGQRQLWCWLQLSNPFQVALRVYAVRWTVRLQSKHGINFRLGQLQTNWTRYDPFILQRRQLAVSEFSSSFSSSFSGKSSSSSIPPNEDADVFSDEHCEQHGDCQVAPLDVPPSSNITTDRMTWRLPATLQSTWTLLLRRLLFPGARPSLRVRVQGQMAVAWGEEAFAGPKRRHAQDGPIERPPGVPQSDRKWRDPFWEPADPLHEPVWVQWLDVDQSGLELTVLKP